MAIHKDTVEVLLAKHGVEFTVEHSGYFDPHGGGSSRLVYFKNAFGVFRLSDHDCIRTEGRRYVRCSDSEAVAELVVCEMAGRRIPDAVIEALGGQPAARLSAEGEEAAAAAVDAVAMRGEIHAMLMAFGFAHLADRPDDDRVRNRVLGSLTARCRRKGVPGNGPL
jgi:hypothetical protein